MTKSQAGISREVLLAVLVLLIYLPFVSAQFGTADDYFFLLHNQTFGTFYSDQGRPITEVLRNFAFSAAQTIPNIRFLRLVGILLTCGLALQLYRLFSISPRLKVVAFWLALALVCLPSFQVHLSFADAFPYPIGSMLGITAASLAMQGAINIRANWGKLILGVALLIIALLIYQPSAMFYWVAVAVLLLSKRIPPRVLLGTYAAHLSVFVIASIVTYAGLRLSGGLGSARTALTQDIGSKVIWFFTDPLKHTLNLYMLPSSNHFAMGVAVFIGIGLWLYFRGRPVQRLLLILISLSLLPASDMPALIASENSASYRTTIALAALILVYLFMAFWGYAHALRTINWRVAKVGLLAAPVALATVASITAAYNISADFVYPLSAELGYLRSELNQIYTDEPSPERLTVVMPRWEDPNRVAPHVIYDEFGMPSSITPWGAISMTRLLLTELGHDPAIEIETYQEPGLPERTNPVIDMRPILLLASYP